MGCAVVSGIQKTKYLISSRMNSKKISQLSLSPNACYVQFKIPSQAELLLSISKGFWIFFVKSNQFISRKIPWTFVKFRCYYYYLPTFKFWKCAESCVSILWLKNSNYPLLATSRGRCLLATSKKFKIQKFAHTKSKKSAKLLLLQYSIPRWFGYLCLERE